MKHNKRPITPSQIPQCQHFSSIPLVSCMTVNDCTRVNYSKIKHVSVAIFYSHCSSEDFCGKRPDRDHYSVHSKQRERPQRAAVWGQKQGLSKTQQAHPLQTKHKTSTCNTFLDLDTQFALSKFQAGFNKVPFMKKQEMTQMNLSAHMTLLFSIYYSKHP